jgi:hypothetical protein
MSGFVNFSEYFNSIELVSLSRRTFLHEVSK